MADIQKRITASGTRWDVRYRDETLRQRKKTFDRKVDAQRFAHSVETDISRGEWIDPNRGRELFGEWADTWLATIANRKPKTRDSFMLAYVAELGTGDPDGVIPTRIMFPRSFTVVGEGGGRLVGR